MEIGKGGPSFTQKKKKEKSSSVPSCGESKLEHFDSRTIRELPCDDNWVDLEMRKKIVVLEV